jgi:hypothetical protein
MHVIKWILVLMLSFSPLKAKMYAYTRLFHPENRTTIDILFDRHTAHPKKQLFISEAKLDGVLTTLNECGEEVDIVWEYDEGQALEYMTKVDVPFILKYPFHIKENLTRLHFIAADRSRYSGYAGLFNWELPASIKPYVNTQGSTFEEPFPFGIERQRLVEERAGALVLKNYRALYAQIVAELTEKFYPAYMTRSTLKNGRENATDSPFHKIADLEMLYHILVSSKKRIVVFCGGRHAARMVSFLTENRYVVLNDMSPTLERGEPSAGELEFLYTDGAACWANREWGSCVERVSASIPVNSESSASAAVPLPESAQVVLKSDEKGIRISESENTAPSAAS